MKSCYLSDMPDAAQTQDQTGSMHHYVTRAYLEGMLAEGEPRLWVYERNSDYAFRNIPKNLASKRSYYTILGPDGKESDQVEKLLSHAIEGPGIHLLRLLAKKDSHQLNWPERVQVSALIAVQEFRVPFAREQLEKMMHGIANSFVNSALNTPGVIEGALDEMKDAGKLDADISAESMRKAFRDGDVVLKMLPEASLQAMGHILPLLIRTYAEMKWTVLTTLEGEFVTSDCPVCREYPITGTVSAGIANPDLTVCFPISQRRVLRLSHDHVRYEKFCRLIRAGREREAWKLRNRTPDISYQIIGRGEVEKVRGLIIRRAQRWVYSPSEDPSIISQFRGECVNLRAEVEADQLRGWLKWTSRIQ
jgi:hypothetical protein